MKIFLKFTGAFLLVILCIVTLSFCTDNSQKDGTDKSESKVESTDSYTGTTDMTDTGDSREDTSEEPGGETGEVTTGEDNVNKDSEQTESKPDIKLGNESDAYWDTLISAD